MWAMLIIEWVSEWLLFNDKSAIFQLYHGENKLIFNVHFVLDQHAELDFYSPSSLKQQFRNLGPFSLFSKTSSKFSVMIQM